MGHQTSIFHHAKGVWISSPITSSRNADQTGSRRAFSIYSDLEKRISRTRKRGDGCFLHSTSLRFPIASSDPTDPVRLASTWFVADEGFYHINRHLVPFSPSTTAWPLTYRGEGFFAASERAARYRALQAWSLRLLSGAQMLCLEIRGRT